MLDDRVAERCLCDREMDSVSTPSRDRVRMRHDLSGWLHATYWRSISIFLIPIRPRWLPSKRLLVKLLHSRVVQT